MFMASAPDSVLSVGEHCFSGCASAVFVRPDRSCYHDISLTACTMSMKLKVIFNSPYRWLDYLGYVHSRLLMWRRHPRRRWGVEDHLLVVCCWPCKTAFTIKGFKLLLRCDYGNILLHNVVLKNFLSFYKSQLSQTLVEFQQDLWLQKTSVHRLYTVQRWMLWLSVPYQHMTDRKKHRRKCYVYISVAALCWRTMKTGTSNKSIPNSKHI